MRRENANLRARINIATRRGGLCMDEHFDAAGSRSLPPAAGRLAKHRAADITRVVRCDLTRVVRYVCAAMVLLLAAGCSRLELNDRGFIMGVAIDGADNGQYELTAQFYKPTEGTAANSPKKESSFRIRATGHSIFDAVRDLSIHVGRKAQWSHMQVILIGEELARTKPLGDILDFFYRDNEPRLTTAILIAKGRAAPYLEEHPYIEKTISRQFRGVEQWSARYSGKTIEMNLLQLQSGLYSETETTVLPYLHVHRQNPGQAVLAGGSIVQKGLVVGTLAPSQMHAYLLLQNKFVSGIVPIPCEKNEQQAESFEIQAAKSTLTPHMNGDSLTVAVSLNVGGTVRELVCTSLQKPEDHEAFRGKIEAELKRQLDETVRSTQKQKADILGIGNTLYKQNPRAWAELKTDWGERFAQIRFEYRIHVVITNTGLGGSKPTFEP